MKKRKSNIEGLFHKLFLFLAILSFSSYLNAQTITVEGTDWTVSIPAITEAGTDYVGPFESTASQVLISMTVPGLLSVGSNANVSAHYVVPASFANTSLVLQRRRTGTGTNGSLCIACTVSGGDTYQNITASPINFFTLSTGIGLGTNRRNNIPVQFRLNGVSVTNPIGSYTAQIVFTVTN